MEDLRPSPTPGGSQATPTRGFKRKIAVLSRGGPEAEGGVASAAAPRKRRWGATATKKPSISISTESLKTLIPDFRSGGGAAGGAELPDEVGVAAGEGPDDVTGGVASPPGPSPHPGLKICRTVTQVVERQNGRGEGQEEEPEEEGAEPEEDDVTGGRGQPKPRPEGQEVGHAHPAQATPTAGMATPSEGEGKGEAPPPRRPGSAPWRGATPLLLPVDEPVRAAPRPSPPRQRPSPIVHLCNLVRPFTLGQLKELLGRTGRLKEDGFWIDRIKSHCFVTYCSVEEAVATREALHGVKWPQSNPKVLSADFAQQEEIPFLGNFLSILR